MKILRPMLGTGLALLGISFLSAMLVLRSSASTVWNGPTISFTNIAGSDPTQPSSQDRLAPDVWITRGSSEGIFNAEAENSFFKGSPWPSPVGTEWAIGELTNYLNLSYTDWTDCFGGQFEVGRQILNNDAVEHLIADDIYLQVRFTSWGGNGGGFIYNRSTAPVPEPGYGALLVAGMTAGALYRPKRGAPKR